MRPTISIVTSTKNCAESLAATALSIRSQEFRGVQWIVVDAASTDTTVEVIRRNQDVVSDWISEPDGGIYEAWNKACAMVRGDWILFLGAGDIFASAQVLQRVAMKLEKLPANIVIAYGNVLTTLLGQKWERRGVVDLSGWDLHRPALPDHQGVFHKAELWSTINFDPTYKVAADSKFMIQGLRLGAAKYLDEDICVMQPGGVSAHPRNVLKIMRECFRLESELGYRLPLVNKATYMMLAYTKYAAYGLGGAAVAEKLARFKRRLWRFTSRPLKDQCRRR